MEACWLRAAKSMTGCLMDRANSFCGAPALGHSTRNASPPGRVGHRVLVSPPLRLRSVPRTETHLRRPYRAEQYLLPPGEGTGAIAQRNPDNSFHFSRQVRPTPRIFFIQFVLQRRGAPLSVFGKGSGEGEVRSFRPLPRHPTSRKRAFSRLMRAPLKRKGAPPFPSPYLG
jgi:hypothetical protein